MNTRKFMILLLSVALFSPLSRAKGASQPPLDTGTIERTTGMHGVLNEKEGVYKVSLPRDDLKVSIGRVKMSPALGLTAWAAFIKTGAQAMVMGDIVMTQEQVNAVMDAALGNGLEVTALHNHFFFDSPKIMFMHIGGMGSEEQLGTAVGKVFAALKETARTPPEFPDAEIDPSRTSLDVAKLNGIFGQENKVDKGVYKATFGRTPQMHGYDMGNAMGVNTWAAISGTDPVAMIDGDFAMLESELQGVLKALRAANIYIVAIHNHMTEEKPRIVFLHYWGIGPAADLAKGVKAALDTQKILK